MKKQLNTKSAAMLASSIIPYFEDGAFEVCKVSNNWNTYILDVLNKEKSDIKSLFDTTDIVVECDDDTDPYSVSESSLISIKEKAEADGGENTLVKMNVVFTDIGIFLSEEAAKESGATHFMWHEAIFQLHNPLHLFERCCYDRDWERQFRKIIVGMWD